MNLFVLKAQCSKFVGMVLMPQTVDGADPFGDLIQHLSNDMLMM